MIQVWKFERVEITSHQIIRSSEDSIELILTVEKLIYFSDSGMLDEIDKYDYLRQWYSLVYE
jgi:hypothetical protein